MRVTFKFSIHSEIRMAEDDWPSISFERSGVRVEILKPVLRERRYSVQFQCKVFPPDAADELMGDLSLLLTIPVTDVNVTLDANEGVGKTMIREFFQPIALEVLGELKSWLRVLTRQYWIGYRGTSNLEEHYKLKVEGERFKTGAAGPGFEYGHVLDAHRWSMLREKLAASETPPWDSSFSVMHCSLS